MPVAISRALAICTLFVLTFPQVVAAEWHFTPNVGVTFSGQTSLGADTDLAAGKAHRTFGGSVSLFGAGIVGAEGLLTWTPGFLTGDLNLVRKSRSIAFMGNAILTAPRRWTEYNLRPFVSGGVGVLRASKTEFREVFPLNRDMPGFNVGGGAIGFFSKRTGVRFDFRYYSTFKRYNDLTAPDGPIHVHYTTASIGLVIRPSW
jgi:hypothetical protein